MPSQNRGTSGVAGGGEGFSLDTSGEVRGAKLIEQPDGNWRSHWSWSDLSPFAQGYIEALFASYLAYDIGPNPHNFKGGFSDLSPEALALSLSICDLRERTLAPAAVPLTADDGRELWRSQQAAESPDLFPPRRVILRDDGKVDLEIAA